MQTGALLSAELCAAVTVGLHTSDTLLLPWRLTGMLLVSKMFNRMLPAQSNTAQASSAQANLEETDAT